MNDPVQIKFVFKSNGIESLIQSKDYDNLLLSIVRIIGRNRPIPFLEFISDDVFQSQISYFKNHQPPNM